MKIQNVDFISISSKQDGIKLSKNSIIEAKLIEAGNNDVLLDLGNGNILAGKTELDLQGLKNNIINFLVKSLDNNKIELKPLLDTTFNNEYESKFLAMNLPSSRIEQKLLANVNTQNNRDILTEENKTAYIKEILSLYKLEENNTSIETIKSMMKFEMPLNKETVTNVIKYINKLESIVSTNENEELYLLEPNHDPLDSDILKIIKNEESQNIEQQDISRKLEVNNKNIADQILAQSKSFSSQNKITPDLIKKVVFLIKCEIDVSINNIKQLTDLIEKGNLFEDKISKIFDELKSSNFINKNLVENLRSRMNNTIVTFSHKDKEKIDTYHKEMRSVVELLSKQIVEKKDISDELRSKIKEVNDSVNLINKLNEHTTFFYLPFTYKNINLKNSFYMLSKKKRTKTSDKISIFMRLETKNLDEIEIMCIAINNRINLSFKVDKNFTYLFEERKSELNDILKSVGYSNVVIRINEKNCTDILDLLSNNEFLNYKLNVKV
ncbi:hypothetical protein [Brassicibacter mesophilus]|uniref:hypothetical protein n=1 Tax=Brassicibacter mesophilus TaxID=745119 RepID=UPI003D1AD32A